MKTILDVSNIVYGGHYGSSDYRIQGFPLGGVRKLLGLINAQMKSSELYLCFDGGSVLKKELLPTYKAGRVPNYSVLAQIDLLKEILEDCNIPFYWHPDYEADDYIFSLVQFFDSIGDREDIVIYSDDRDISCCVSEHVSIKNVTSQGICIDKRNFEVRAVEGERIPFNTVLIWKMMFGDKSDNYKGLYVPGLDFNTFANAFINTVEPYLADGSLPESSFANLDIMEIVIDSLPESITPDMKHALKEQAMLVFPQRVNVTAKGIRAFIEDATTSGDPLFVVERRHLKSFGLNSINHTAFMEYCNLLKLNRCYPDRYTDTESPRISEFKTKLRLRAKELSSGAMAVERYQSKRIVRASEPILENMKLPL